MYWLHFLPVTNYRRLMFSNEAFSPRNPCLPPASIQQEAWGKRSWSFGLPRYRLWHRGCFVCSDCSQNLCEQLESGDGGGENKIKVGFLRWVNELGWILGSAREAPAFQRTALTLTDARCATPCGTLLTLPKRQFLFYPLPVSQSRWLCEL